MQARIYETSTEYYGTLFKTKVTNAQGITREVYVWQDLQGNLDSVVWGYGGRSLNGFNNFREAAYQAVRESLAA